MHTNARTQNFIQIICLISIVLIIVIIYYLYKIIFQEFCALNSTKNFIECHACTKRKETFVAVAQIYMLDFTSCILMITFRIFILHISDK